MALPPAADTSTPSQKVPVRDTNGFTSLAFDVQAISRADLSASPTKRPGTHRPTTAGPALLIPSTVGHPNYYDAADTVFAAAFFACVFFAGARFVIRRVAVRPASAARSACSSVSYTHLTLPTKRIV